MAGNIEYVDYSDVVDNMINLDISDNIDDETITVNDIYDKNSFVVEPLLDENNEQFTMFPIKYPQLWDMYKAQQNSYWRAEEIDFSRDADDFITLTEDEQYFVKMILAFFASSDGIVNFNLRERFMNEIKINEALVVYGWQTMMENIHSETYSLMLENIIKDKGERENLFNAIKTVDSIKMMYEWARKWIDSQDSFAHRVVAFACVEGIFFCGAFAAIFWLKKYRSNGKNIMDGLVKSNQLISRDESMHTQFACMLYKMLLNKLDEKKVHAIVSESVEISKIFVKDAIKCHMIGMNLELMNEYIQYVADTLLVMLGHSKIYNNTNPFGFMESIGLLNKTNFFESRPTEYQAAFNAKNTAKQSITILNDF
ncbi:MAG: ribonucleoside diphosphate reductase beta subunit [Terrestrivirus sp.]|uniref:Ribonucleoside-diphosphate reductase small chain n=1 Tax=Terrestrivirus sp. TaxID=2487775 RepID=A0A3G4ZR60_9VIRU|nr:MAG: ribonucleoside diphosphate reductase beta subunit [Terrestrivirus sp.]